MRLQDRYIERPCERIAIAILGAFLASFSAPLSATSSGTVLASSSRQLFDWKDRVLQTFHRRVMGIQRYLVLLLL